jgi:glutamate synthase (NADPH) small chain
MKEILIPLFAFIEQVRKEPQKISIEERIKQFAKIYLQYTQHEATTQSERCLDCGNPYCQWQCPVHNYIPLWLKLVAQGKILEAAEIAHRTNTLPEVCGQVCPQEQLCEKACTLNDQFGAVTIGAIENYLTETALSQGWKPDLSGVIQQSKRVAIIGAGPAGLGCADKLIREGITVNVYDRYPEIGGLLTFGIPEFKLEKNVMLRRRKLFEEMGIIFYLNHDINHSKQLDQLLKENDALFLGLGATEGLKAAIPGESMTGVLSALPFLIKQIRYLLGIDKTIPYDFKHKKVVILGAGDTAMDCARTAIRLGADSVTCVYRRDESNRTGTKKDFENAKQEGVQWIWQHQAVSFEGKDALNSIKLAKTYTDNNGQLLINDHEIARISADIAIVAYGFNAKPAHWFKDHGIECNDQGLIKASVSANLPLQTSHHKIFAGGDMVLGANLVVNAIAQGHKAAQSIIKMLSS